MKLKCILKEEVPLHIFFFVDVNDNKGDNCGGNDPQYYIV